MNNPQQQSKSIENGIYRWLHLQPKIVDIKNFHQQTIIFCEEKLENAKKELSDFDNDVQSAEKNNKNNEVSFFYRYKWYLRQNTFLMLFSFIEEFLASTYLFKTGAEVSASGSNIGRFLKPYSNDIKIALNANNRDWEFLQTCQKIRNGLLHANGRIALLKGDLKMEVEKILSDKKLKEYFGTREGALSVLINGRDDIKYIKVKGKALDKLLHIQQSLEKLLLEN